MDGTVYAGADVTVGVVSKDYATGNADLFVQGNIETDADIYGRHAFLTGNASVTGTSTLTGAVTTGGDVTLGAAVDTTHATTDQDLFVKGSITTDTNIYGLEARLTTGLTAGTVNILTNVIAATGENGLHLYDNASNGLTLRDGGNVGIGTSAPAAMLHVGNAPTSLAVDLTLYSAIIKGDLAVDGHVYGDGSLMSGVVTTIGLTDGYVPKTSGAVMIDSLIYDNGTNVGLGTAVPRARLEVVGLDTDGGVAFQVDDSLYAAKLTVLGNGNVGMGSAVPAARLHVGSPGAPNAIAFRTANDAYIAGHLEVDGKIYGDGSQISALDASQSYYSGLYPTVRNAIDKLMASTAATLTAFWADSASIQVGGTTSSPWLGWYVTATSGTDYPATVTLTLPAEAGGGSVAIGTTYATWQSSSSRYYYHYQDSGNSYSKNTAGEYVRYSLTVNDGIKDTTRTADITFYNARYWGVSSNEADAVEADINGFASQAGVGGGYELATSRTMTKTGLKPTAQYIYVAYPFSWGAPTVSINGYDETGVTTIMNHTNSSGHTESYYVWHSTNKLTFTGSGYSVQVK